MSGPLGSQQWMYSTGFYPYEIDQSLRFNDDDSAYLSRTFASAGNRKTWTWSGWVKRSELGSSQQYIFTTVSDNTSNGMYLYFASDALIVWDYRQGTSSTLLQSNAVYRDVSSWYHIVLTVDRTATTASDRTKLYVNGSQVTSFATAVYPNQNEDSWVNQNTAHYISAPTLYFDGYIAEVNFIDGQALDPTSFGEFKSGVWIPKSYSGSYGTNGFYLDFGNSGSLGADSSGNGNNWTPNNLAATDQVPDSPTNNFATLNPLQTAGGVTLSEGNLVTETNGAALGSMTATFGASTGKWYFESCSTSGVTAYPQVGLINDNPSDGELYGSANTGSVLFQFDGKIYTNNGSGYVLDQTTTGTSSGDVVGVALDLDNQECSFFVNNTQVGTTVDISYMSSDVLIRFGFAYYSANLLANFGQDSSFAGNKTAQGNTDANGIGDFYYAPPSGYLALCTANLPDPVAAIDPALGSNPQDHFNTVVWSAQSPNAGISVTGVGFQPDLVWAKVRSQSWRHNLYDVLRGTGNAAELASNTTFAEGGGDNESYDYLSSFDSDGFSSTWSGSNFAAYFNQSGQTYVAWNWKAGGTGVSNTDGTITSTVSANVDAGFSIVSYTGNGTNPSTIGHGLGAVPAMVITKSRSATGEWPTYHKSLTPDYTLYLNATYAASTYQNRYDYSAFTTDVFSTAATSGSELNTSGVTYISYCFAEVDGFSKFGSYTGNGSSDGPFVYTGFRPAFVMIKRTNVGGDSWFMFDTARDTFNSLDSWLGPNLSNAEGSNTFADFLSNGFKLRGSISAFNGSNDTYIYMAFAEMPTKYSLGR